MRLTRPAFIAWLESHRPLQRVGREGRCPLDVYFGNNVKGIEDSNGTGSTTYTVKGVTRDLPKWAAQFVYDVDHRPGYWANVTAQKALAILLNPGPPVEID